MSKEMQMNWLASLAVGIAACAQPACAQDAAIADFYRGKPINWIVGTGEGGGYDLSSRLAAQYISRFIPGSPTVVVRNMPGAGSIAAAEYVFANGPKDGTMLAMFYLVVIIVFVTVLLNFANKRVRRVN